ncbi:MAG: formate C-acetyltransferase [Alphaproteobacteria bacterium]|jgi:formate C-acetyltransferase|nr:formate C-acetyltransferase [Alphaproteobacteria bacterium]
MTNQVEKNWEGFIPGEWNDSINVRDFIQKNYTPYEGDDSFLAPVTERTTSIWEEVLTLMKAEIAKGGVLDCDTSTPSAVNAFKAGYINKDKEIIVGLQTDAPLKRAIMPYGGYRMVQASCDAYGLEEDKNIREVFTKYRKTHNDGVFQAYTPAIRECRRSGIITGLPDAYGRGRIIGDYRRIALYGIDRLIEDKMAQKAVTDGNLLNAADILEREEISEQIIALGQMKEMADAYGIDISKPAKDTKEAVQFTYFGYLAAIKDQNGAAMSLGRVSTFLDVYAERDMKAGTYTESDIQEIMDDFIIKLRMVRFLRTPEYNALFSGDPVWITETIGGMGLDGRTLVTKNSFRFLHTLTNIGPAPEPNLTVFWSTKLPKGFKDFCARMSIETSSIQYENDDLMIKDFGDDYGIACCVSPMTIGKQMQFFGARANLAKALLYAINGGVDEKSFKKVVDGFEPITSEYLDYDEVCEKFDKVMDWLTKTYVNALNIIHFMHDKYYYEKAQMALMDREVERNLGCGIAGFSVVVDSLSAIKNAKVKTIRNEDGVVVDFEIEGDYPKFGNNDDAVDDIAVSVTKQFMDKIRKIPAYRDAVPSQSILTITSNVVYGKKTGNTPDGRKAGEPFAPGANPLHGRDTHGALASLCSVAKVPFADAKDGISNTFSIIPNSLGKDEATKIGNLTALLDGYVSKSGQHLNVNVLNLETLQDAMEHPENYPQLTIRVSGYAVNFIKLTKEQQLDVISRTFHEKI